MRKIGFAFEKSVLITYDKNKLKHMHFMIRSKTALDHMIAPGKATCILYTDNFKEVTPRKR